MQLKPANILLLVATCTWTWLDQLRAEEICPLSPHVTSMSVRLKRIQPGMRGELIRFFDLNFFIDYKLNVTVPDFQFLLGQRAYSDQTPILDESSSLRELFTYRRDIYPFESGIQLSHGGKEESLLDIKNRKDLSEPKVALELFRPCSKLLIFTADFSFKIEPDKVVKVLYHKATRCRKIISTPNSTIGEVTEYLNVLNLPLKTNIIAAAYSERIIFELDHQQILYIRPLLGEPTYDNPFGDLTDLDLMIKYDLFMTPLMRASIVYSGMCHFQLNELRNVAKDLLFSAELDGWFTLSTLTRLNRTAFIGSLSGNFSETRTALYSQGPNNSLGLFIAEPILWFTHPEAKMRNYLWAMSIVVDSQSNLRVVAVFDISGAPRRELIYFNTKLERKFDVLLVPSEHPSTLVDMEPPDDVAHWSSCKKVVSFYGFMYGLHNYTDDIFLTPTRWQQLDQTHFDYPIETVHAEGDEFWFTFKNGQVMMMIADSSNCSTLSLKFYQKVHIRQALGENPTNLNLPGRYYSSKRKQWIPSMQFVPPMKTVASSSIPPFVYIICGVLAGIIILALALTYLCRSLSHQPAQIVYSNSRSLTDIKLQSEPKPDHSIIPLMSRPQSGGVVTAYKTQTSDFVLAEQHQQQQQQQAKAKSKDRKSSPVAQRSPMKSKSKSKPQTKSASKKNNNNNIKAVRTK